jgi:hypothetical protein
VFNKEWQRFTEAFDGIEMSIDKLQDAFNTLSTTRRKKLDGVLDKIDALRIPERDVTAELPSTAAIPMH